jgi:hypothetical protein
MILHLTYEPLVPDYRVHFDLRWTINVIASLRSDKMSSGFHSIRWTISRMGWTVSVTDRYFKTLPQLQLTFPKKYQATVPQELLKK